jgi:preprotein translocase subunit SecE
LPPAAPNPRGQATLGALFGTNAMFGKIAQFISEVQSEMGKVSWPTREELKSSTTIVLALTAVLAVFIFVVDYILAGIMDLILI